MLNVDSDNQNILPPHLEKLVDGNSKLTDAKRNQLQSLLLDFEDVFYSDDLGRNTIVQHTIDTGNARDPFEFLPDEYP